MSERAHGITALVRRMADAIRTQPERLRNGHRTRSPERAAAEQLLSAPCDMRDAVAERFWERTEPEATTGCLLWLGFVHPKTGYGDFRVGGVTLPAHRVALLLAGGTLQPGEEAAHRCNVRSCVEPRHLRPLTHAENQAESIGLHVGKKNAGEKNGNARLTTAQVVAIRDAYRDGNGTLESLAEAFGYSLYGMASVISGKRYPAVPGAVPVEARPRGRRPSKQRPTEVQAPSLLEVSHAA